MKTITKSAFIALVGKPNVGKSTLLNQLIGQKISATSRRPQTTRRKVAGICTIGETQLIFYDTPGLLKAKDRLQERMVSAARGSVLGVDLAVLVTEPSSKISPADRSFIELFKKQKLPAILVINKIDLLKDKEKLLEMIKQYHELYDFAAVVPLSAKKKDGVDRLKKEILSFSYESVHYFPDDMVTDQAERTLAAEAVREKILIHMREEIPHGVAVETELFERRRGKLQIRCVIYCDKKNHKGMIIGKGGTMLKLIASSARRDMEEQFGTKVHLTCWVKVKENWRNREKYLEQFGFSE